MTRRNVFIIGSLLAVEITGSFETAMIFAAQRALTDDLGDPVRVGWLITSYLLIGAGAAALAGRLGDKFGRKRLLLAMLALAIVGSLMSAFAVNYAMLLAGRCIQGMTGALLPLCVGLVREHLPGKSVPMGIGLMISGASAGTAAGLVIGGLIVDHFSWPGVFLASAIFAATSMTAAAIALPRGLPRKKEGSVDWLGGVLFVPAVFGLLLAITTGPHWGIGDWRTLTALAIGLGSLIAWITSSLRNPNPLLDVRLFADRQVLVANGVTALVALGALQITLVFSLLLQAPVWTGVGLGVTATVAGFAKLPSNIGSLAGGPLSGWMTGRGGGRITMITGGALTVLGWLLAMFFAKSLLAVVFVLIVISFGTTILFAVGPTIIAGAVPHDRTSEAAGMMTVVRQVFMGIGAQLVSVILASQTISRGDSAQYPTPGAFFLTMALIAGMTAVATLLAFFLPRNAGLEVAPQNGSLPPGVAPGVRP